ncbi:glutathione S-transferase [Gammaproteobacteria bacterium 42_54_T18]|nr:glutathione S-transferase [Gammaproteobacteria bacterium 42_54_T18]
MNEPLTNGHPLLYSFRRCPYAMRARLALYSSGIQVALREVVLRDKPADLRELSPKATVPVLVTPEGQVIDESLDIMLWALEQSDPEGWLLKGKATMVLIGQNDGQFKHWLDHYKYADRFPEHSASYYREQAEVFIAELEARLSAYSYLMAEKLSLADVAIFPFIRQFAHVDKSWFDQAPYPKVQIWLAELLKSSRFTDVMVKYPQWHVESDVVLFGQKP